MSACTSNAQLLWFRAASPPVAGEWRSVGTVPGVSLSFTRNTSVVPTDAWSRPAVLLSAGMTGLATTTTASSLPSRVLFTFVVDVVVVGHVSSLLAQAPIVSFTTPNGLTFGFSIAITSPTTWTLT